MSETLIISLIILCGSAAGVSIIPWAIPFVIIMIAGLLASGVDPMIVSIVSRAGAVGGAVSLRRVDKYMTHYYRKYAPQVISSKPTRLKTRLKRIQHKLHIIDKQHILGVLVIITTCTAIPDILIVKAVRHKLSLGVFILSIMIGKIFVYTPIVYGIELIKLRDSNRDIF